MTRVFVCAAVAVVFCAGSVLAAKGDIVGAIKKIDEEKGVITVAVKVKKETMDKDFTITKDTKFLMVTGDETKDLATGKDGLKSLKEGANVVIIADGDKPSEVRIVEKKKKKE